MKKDWLKITIIFLITVGVVFWTLSYLFLNNNTSRSSKATADLVNIVYDPATVSVEAGKDFTIKVKISPTQNISLRGYNVGFSFDKSKLQLKSITYNLGVVSSGLGDTTNTITQVNADGKIDAIGEIQNSTGLVVASGSTVDLLTLTFNAPAATGTTISGNKASFYTLDTAGTISTNLIANIPDLAVNGGTGPAACTSFNDDFSGSTINSNNWNLWTNNGGTATFGGEATLSLPASTDGVAKGVTLDSWGGKKNISAGDFSAEVLLKSLSTTNNATMAGSLISFAADTNDDRSVQIQRMLDGYLLAEVNNTASDSAGYTNTNKSLGLTNSTPVKAKIERKGNTMNMYYDILDGKGYQLIRTFDGFYTGSGRIFLGAFNYTPNFPQATAKFDDFKLTCVASPTPTGGGSGNVKLNLKLKFQGITGKPAGTNSMTVTGKLLKDATGAQPVSGTGTFTADSSGIWSGTVGFNIADVTGKYFLLLSGDKSMAKKFCDSAPTESTPGTYHCSKANITIAVGDNNLDLSKVVILAGDLNQDGIVDSVDFSTVKNLLGKTDADSNKKADINHDGRVDTQDVSLIITALSFKFGDSF